MLIALQRLISLLTSDPLTVEDVVSHLGTMVEDLGASVVVTPVDPIFRSVIVVRNIDLETREPCDVPALVQLTPAEAPLLEKLGATFGPYREIPPDDRGQLPRAIIYLQSEEGRCLIALIAEISEGRAVTITLRRDVLI